MIWILVWIWWLSYYHLKQIIQWLRKFSNYHHIFCWLRYFYSHIICWLSKFDFHMICWLRYCNSHKISWLSKFDYHIIFCLKYFDSHIICWLRYFISHISCLGCDDNYHTVHWLREFHDLPYTLPTDFFCSNNFDEWNRAYKVFVLKKDFCLAQVPICLQCITVSWDTLKVCEHYAHWYKRVVNTNFQCLLLCCLMRIFTRFFFSCFYIICNVC